MLSKKHVCSITYLNKFTNINPRKILIHLQYVFLKFSRCLQLPCIGLCKHLYHCNRSDDSSLCKHTHKIHSHQLQLKQRQPVKISAPETDEPESLPWLLWWYGVKIVPSWSCFWNCGNIEGSWGGRRARFMNIFVNPEN